MLLGKTKGRIKLREKLYLFSTLSLLLILISSLLQSFNLKGRVKELENQIFQLTTYKKSPPDLTKDSALMENNLPREYRQAVKAFIANNIEDIVNEDHMMGGRWIVTHLSFLSPSRIQIEYEDGHSAGQLVLGIDELEITNMKYHVPSR